MNKKIFRYGNNFYNFEKLIAAETDLDNHQVHLTFEGGVTKTLEHKANDQNRGFYLFIFNPLCAALERGDFDYKVPKDVHEEYLKEFG